MAGDEKLQVRAGLNTGNEPAVLAFIEKAGSKSKTGIPLDGSRHVIFEGVENALRSPGISANQNGSSGYVYNDGATSIDYTLYFQDDEGNYLPLGGAVTVPATTPVPLEILMVEEGQFALCPGEKILISAIETPQVG